MAENRKPKPEPDDQEQSRRFVEMAKLLEADRNSDAFEAALSTISSSPQIPAAPDRTTKG